MDFIPTSIQGVFAFVFILLTLVVIHEFGHFLAAKAFGIKVLEFGVGFPPKAFSRKFGETEYSVNWLPIGGFVRLLGEEDPSDPRSLAAASRPKRLAVMAAGVVMNLIVAVLLLTIGFMIPRERSLSLAQVTEVSVDSPAYCADVTGEMRDGTHPAPVSPPMPRQRSSPPANRSTVAARHRVSSPATSSPRSKGATSRTSPSSSTRTASTSAKSRSGRSSAAARRSQPTSTLAGIRPLARVPPASASVRRPPAPASMTRATGPAAPTSTRSPNESPTGPTKRS